MNWKSYNINMINIKQFIETKKVIIILAVIIIALLGFITYRSGSKKSIPENEENLSAETTETSAVATTETSATPTVKKPTTSQTQPIIKKTTTAIVDLGIKIITPALGESWTFGKIHTIRWSTGAGIKGYIELLDASTKQIIGWITPEISSSQTYFDWDTKMVSVGRMDPSRKDITPGNYIIKIVFDGPKSPIESAMLSIISSADEKIITNNNVLIQNGIFAPNFITIRTGDKVIIVNNETALKTIQINNIPVAILSKNSAYVFEPKAAGTYELRLKEQILAKLTVVVQ